MEITNLNNLFRRKKNMKMKKTVCAILAAVLIIAVFTGPASAAIYTDKADDLKFLGLFLGTELGYELDRAPTRAEAAALLVRLLGKEAEAKKNDFAHPFTDVPEWANVYIGYLYENNLANGISADKFGSGELCTMQMFCTFVLRALGYSDAGDDADFTYAEAVDFAAELGLADDEIKAIAGELFNRDCCVAIMHNALFADVKGVGSTLIIKLVDDDWVIEGGKAFVVYLKRAEQGDAAAQHEIAWAYNIGLVAAKDPSEAVKWWTAAAEQGYLASQYDLAWYYFFYSEDEERDHEEAAKWFTKAAEQGYYAAQNDLGWCYYNAIGVEEDYGEAVKWYTKSAEQGYGEAQNNLGFCYYNGYGAEKDYEKAVKWWTAAAEQGHSLAQYRLAWRYYNGEGVDKDPSEAVKWWTAAAEQGHVDSQYELADCYHSGEGVEQNEAEAVKWWAKAAENGNTDAMVYLAWQYFDGEILENDYGKAVEWVTKAAEQGNNWAIESLEFMENNKP